MRNFVFALIVSFGLVAISSFALGTVYGGKEVAAEINTHFACTPKAEK